MMPKVLCTACGQWFEIPHPQRPLFGSCGSVICKLERHVTVERWLEKHTIAQDVLIQGLAGGYDPQDADYVSELYLDR